MRSKQHHKPTWMAYTMPPDTQAVRTRAANVVQAGCVVAWCAGSLRIDRPSMYLCLRLAARLSLQQLCSTPFAAPRLLLGQPLPTSRPGAGTGSLIVNEHALCIAVN